MEIRKDLLDNLLNIAENEYFNEKWITIKPHGEDSDDYRRLKLEDGETPKEAIDRVYKKKDKTKESENKALNKINTGSIYKGKTWQEILEKRKNPNETKSWWLEKVYKPGESLLSDDVFSHYILKAEGKGNSYYKTTIPKELNDYIKRNFVDEKYITKAKVKEPEKSVVDTNRDVYLDTVKKYKQARHDMWHATDDKTYYKSAADEKKYKSELTKVRKAYAESIMDNFQLSDSTAYEDKLQAKKDRYKELEEKNRQASAAAHQASRDMIKAIPMGQPILVGHYSEKSDRAYRERAFNKLGEGVRLSEKADYYKDKASSVGTSGISSDDANAIAKLAEKYKSGRISSAERRRIIDRVIEIDTMRRKAGQQTKEDYSSLGFNVERNQDANRLQLKFDGIPTAETRDVLKRHGFKWSPKNQAWQRQLNLNSERALKEVAEKLKK